MTSIEEQNIKNDIENDIENYTKNDIENYTKIDNENDIENYTKNDTENDIENDTKNDISIDILYFRTLTLLLLIFFFFLGQMSIRVYNTNRNFKKMITIEKCLLFIYGLACGSLFIIYAFKHENQNVVVFRALFGISLSKTRIEILSTLYFTSIALSIMVFLSETFVIMVLWVMHYQSTSSAENESNADEYELDEFNRPVLDITSSLSDDFISSTNSVESINASDVVSFVYNAPSDDAVPSVGAVPSIDAVPLVGAVPSIDAVSSVGAVPSVGAVSSIFAVPSVGAVPSIGAVSSIGAVPSFDADQSIDDVPSVDAVADRKTSKTNETVFCDL